MPLRDNQLLDRAYTASARPDLEDANRTLLQRAAFLQPRDRMLVELAIKNHASHRQLGLALNMPAGTVTRRLRRLLNRLHEPLVFALLDPPGPLPEEHRQLGIEHFLQGQTIRQLAEIHQMSPATARQMIEYIRGWFRAVGRPSRWR